MAKNKTETKPSEPTPTEGWVTDPSSERKPVSELRKETDAPAWKHNAASQLHGWAEHKHHMGCVIKLTKADYLSAIESACCNGGRPTPHKAALFTNK